MNRPSLCSSLFAETVGIILVLTIVNRCAAQDNIGMKVPYEITPRVYSFDLKDVRLLDGPFRDAMQRDEKYLLSLEPDRFLHTFRVTAGLPSTAKPYGGWEAPDVELRGHSLGHYLSALSLMYASTGNDAFKSRAEAIVGELHKVQDAMPSRGFHAGYLSAFPEEFFDRVDSAKRVWAPYYTIHKIMAGLLDVYVHCGTHEALDVVTKMADWVKFRVDRLSEEQQQKALGNEFGGMSEVLENIYAVTGDRKYLATAGRFYHKAILDSLAAGIDPLDGLHANTQFPKIIGAAREYELTGDKRFADIAEFFWDRVALHRSYVIGGNSDDEAFFPVKEFSKHLGAASTETCNMYNMLKLTRHLFEWNPSATMMDYYERGLYNQILASQDPATGMMTYYVPLKPGAFKTFSTPTESFWCCVGTGMENHAKYGETIYFHNDNALYVNLFIPSELNWKEKGIRVRQETQFPEDDVIHLTFACAKPVNLSLQLRYPSWAQAGMMVAVNGKSVKVGNAPGSYVAVERRWKNGDKVDIRVPMNLRMESMPDDPTIVALLYGPIVLAGDLGDLGPDSTLQYGPSAPPMGRIRSLTVPAFVCDPTQILAAVKPAGDAPLHFKTTGIGQPADVSLVPFYRMFKDRYTVYWKVYSPAEWKVRKAEMDAAIARRSEIERRTVDSVKVGDHESEREHHLQGDTTLGGFFDGEGWRGSRNGWFSYDLHFKPGTAVTFVCTYRGSEGRRRTFDVLIDNVRIATQSLQYHPTELFDVEYRVPDSLLAGKTTLTLKFQAQPQAFAGSVFDVRVVQ